MDEIVKTKLKESLQSGHDEVRVTFTKKDGTVREMRCTTNLGLVPAEKWPVKKEGKADSSSSETTCTVWDLDKEDWRAFRYDSVTKIEMKEYYVWNKEPATTDKPA